MAWKYATFLPQTPNRPVGKNLTTNIILANVALWTLHIGAAYGNQIFALMQAMDGFGKRFGGYDKHLKQWTLSATQLSVFNSLGVVSDSLVVVVCARYIAGALGRRAVYLFAIALHLAGFAVCYTSAWSFAQMVAGRLLCSGVFAAAQVTHPMLQAEFVPGGARGKMIALNGLSMAVSGLVSAGVAYRTSAFDDDRCWRYLLLSALVLPAVSIGAIALVPESPRWLVRQGREEEAARVLHWLYSCREDYSEEEGVRLIKESLEESKAHSKGKWKDMWRGPNRRRTGLVFWAAFFQHFSGIAFSAAYGVLFFRQIGGFNAFTAQMIRRAVNLADPIINAAMMDSLPRRKVRMTFTTLLTVSFLIMGGLGAINNPPRPRKLGIVVLFILIPVWRALGITGSSRVLMSEAPHLELREKSTVVFGVTAQVCEFANTFSIPYLLNPPYANLQARIAFIYGGFCLFSLLWTYFCFPDLKRRSLEEIEEMFVERVPANRTRLWKSTKAESTGKRITDMENGEQPQDMEIEVVEITQKQ